MPKRTLALALALLLAACEFGPTKLIRPGTMAVGRLEARTDIAWSRLPFLGSFRQAATVYGPLLDRLVLVGGVAEGETLFSVSETTLEAPVPFRPAATPLELVEFVFHGLRQVGFVGATLDTLQPASFAGGEGFRAEFRLRDGHTGVAHRGLVVARVTGGRFFAIIFVAADDFYFPTLLPAVERIVESARIV